MNKLEESNPSSPDSEECVTVTILFEISLTLSTVTVLVAPWADPLRVIASVIVTVRVAAEMVDAILVVSQKYGETQEVCKLFAGNSLLTQPLQVAPLACDGTPHKVVGALAL